jgi:hypothetical protein
MHLGLMTPISEYARDHTTNTFVARKRKRKLGTGDSSVLCFFCG